MIQRAFYCQKPLLKFLLNFEKKLSLIDVRLLVQFLFVFLTSLRYKQPISALFGIRQWRYHIVSPLIPPIVSTLVISHRTFIFILSQYELYEPTTMPCTYCRFVCLCFLFSGLLFSHFWCSTRTVKIKHIVIFSLPICKTLHINDDKPRVPNWNRL